VELSARETDKLRGVDEMSIHKYIVETANMEHTQTTRFVRARVFLTAMRLYIQYKWDMAVLIIMAVSIVFVTVAFLEAVRAVGE